MAASRQELIEQIVIKENELKELKSQLNDFDKKIPKTNNIF